MTSETEMTDMLNALSAAKALGQPRPAGIPPAVNLPWTADSVRQELLISDKDITGALGTQLSDPEKSGNPEEKRLLQQFNQTLAGMDIKPPPKLLVDHGGFFGNLEDATPLLISAKSKEDTPYVVVTPGFISGLDPKLQGVLLKHELTQFANGDLKPEALAQMENSPDEAMRRKFKADKDTGDPGALETALRAVYAAQEKLYLQLNPGKTPQDFKTFYDQISVVNTRAMMAHPPIDQRLGRLEFQRQNLPDNSDKSQDGPPPKGR